MDKGAKKLLSLPIDAFKWIAFHITSSKDLTALRLACKTTLRRLSLSVLVECTDHRFETYNALPTPPELSQERRLMLEWYHSRPLSREGRSLALTDHYLRFIQLMKYHPSCIFSPPAIVDDCWHQHILDTMGYAAFCARFVRRFLHHSPGLPAGMELSDVRLKTYEYFKKLFGLTSDEVWDPEPPMYQFCCCFEKQTRLRVSDTELKAVEDIQPGDYLLGGDRQPHRVLRVESVVTPIKKRMVNLGDFWITRGHPVLVGGEWYRPDELCPTVDKIVQGLYNFVLEEEHTVLAGEKVEYVCCTLGKDCGPRLAMLFPEQNRTYGTGFKG